MLRVQQRARERDLALDVARRLGLEQRVERAELRLVRGRGRGKW